MSKTRRQKIGTWGELRAGLFLSKKGYDIVATNYEVMRAQTKIGEIDIIAWHRKPRYGKTLCFVEVKTRSRDDGSAGRATRGKKMVHIQDAARYYCIRHAIDIERAPIQFELVRVFVDVERKKALIRHCVIPQV